MAKSDWFPWLGVDDLAEEMDRLIEEASMRARTPGRGEPRGFWMPVADVMETGDAFVIEAELPGVRRQDIVLELRDGELWIYGERRREKDAQGSVYQVMERSRGPFARRFQLPRGADPGKALAVFGNGLLTVTLPKNASRLGSSVRIEISG